MNPYLERSWNVTWSFGGRAAATRAASAGVWASWACAATLFLARCLTAPDFQVKKTTAYLKDPQQVVLIIINLSLYLIDHYVNLRNYYGSLLELVFFY